MTPLSRPETLARLQARDEWDLVVIGGGATGCGVALDAAARGFSVVLLEAEDFAEGTSSRATKLVHGGVRYLAQGNVSLVREALHERATLLANAPHLAQPLAFVMPGYRWWERGFYGIGLKMYDALAGARSLGDTELLSAARTRELLPTVRAEGLAGGVKYWDGQFDDARLALALARTAAARGALVLNHCPVVALRRERGQVRGVVARDAESGVELPLRARCVVNATGVWVDDVRRMDREADAPERAPMVAPSQGVHLIVDRRFLPGTHALLVPKTADGRVLFAVPWQGKTILGTTDTPREDVVREPAPFGEEVDFILREAGRYLALAPAREDVRSVWVGLRPLVKPTGDDGDNTKAISREHTVLVGRSGLVTVTGGKWTTYRAMAEDVLDRCFERGLLPRRAGGVTVKLPLVGAPAQAHVPLTAPPGEHLYGTEAAALAQLPGAARWLWRDAETGEGGLSEAMVRFAVRHEMARTVGDVLARRSRLLFLDAAAAAGLARPVAAILAEEIGGTFDADASAAAFEALAAQYRHLP
ncbi:MAG TPA: glycerol-3-phosphate dehydrogenase/oxidase [Burkholderiaceae bacterium]|nr:glycerol-3-phosphate dehydrogenase/oxidase [Burkholderiaceae bacterium]